jgi:hypothetical protein
MNYKFLNNLTGWLVFAISTIVYILTIEPTASFWDCGEFIATAYKLEVGHPPGAPLFMLLGRLFAAFVPVEHAALSINVLSAISSSFTILFLFWTITALAKKLALLKGELTNAAIIAVLGSGVVGGLAYTFSDSFWFSAVEGEVYAMSSLFTAVVFWAILKWEALEDRNHETRWIVFIAYMMGLSIGVHLLNLLTIPAIALVYYFKKYPPTLKGTSITLGISLVILGVIQALIIPGVVKLAGAYEVFFTNTIGAPFQTGALYFALLTFAFIAFNLMHSKSPDRKKAMILLGVIIAAAIPLLLSASLSGTAKFVVVALFGLVGFFIYRLKSPSVILNTSILSLMVILIGYSTFTMIVIRSSANPPMDENNPENVFTLLSYLNREQYGDRPLLYGPYYSAPLDMDNPKSDGTPVWMKAYVVKDGKKTVRSFNNEFEANKFLSESGNTGYKLVKEYIISDARKNANYNYSSQFMGVFPRMYSTQQHHIEEYESWSDFVGKPIRARGNDGQMTVINKPTFVENIRFFLRYQVNWMYWRYFMWNFAGRQNDIQGHGTITDGNWLTGIKMIDEQRLGNQNELPSSMTENKAYNRLYLLPMILGLIGLIYQLSRSKTDWLVVMLLFLLTGLAIVVYLNQYPMQPRERDYAYSGSFYAFAIWIGLGVFALFDAARGITMKELQRAATITFGAGAVLYVFEAFGSDHSVSYALLYMGLVAFGALLLIHFAGKAVKADSALAVLAVMLGLSVPGIMAAEGWNDHNRAGRYTGVDFAKNYLESCEPNSIIFTNGDNDTFPLWYVQEVEGFRTDIRVCNLSLLNTDWYIDQMKRKAYESEPLPISIEEEKYRQGTRDIVYLDPSRNPKGIFVDVSQAIKFALEDKNLLALGGGENLHYMPTKTFSLPVDSARMIELGIVDTSMAGQIVPSIDWKINKTYLLKNNFIVLDMLATNNWKRPIYFAVTTGPDSYMNLQDYFRLEGLAYRLVPIKAPKNPNPNVTGSVSTDLMYDNLMNKFHWGGMDSDKQIYLDENNLRMTTNMRLQFSNLADELIRKGEMAQAREILFKCLEVMPEHNVPYTRIMLPITESLYKVKEEEAANKLANRLFDLFEENLRYYYSLSPAHARSVQNEMQIAMYVAQRLDLMVNELYPQDDAMKASFTERFKALEEGFEQAMTDIELSKRKSSKASF